MNRYYCACFVVLCYGTSIMFNTILTIYATNVSAAKHVIKIPTAWYCGFKTIAADFYWCLLQLHDDINAEYIFHTADNITDLDPHYNIVYRYAAIRLLIEYSDANLATTLLEKSLPSCFNNDDWRIYFYLVYAYKFFLHDQTKAHHYYAVMRQQQYTNNHYLKKDRNLPPEYLFSGHGI